MRLVAIYLILLVHVMDTSIANVALLSITTDLRMDAFDGHWVVTAFGVGMAGAIPFVPRVVEWLGARAALAALLGISAASIALCGLGDSFATLVLSRFLQGVSSGGVVLLAQRLLLNAVGPARRSYGMALWTSALSIAPVIGPFLGAVVIGLLNWRWLFLGQLPLLALASLVIVDEMSLRKPPATPPMDGVAVLLFCGAMLCLELALGEALDAGRGDGRLAALSLLGLPALLLALRWRLARAGGALFDASVLRNRAFRGYTAHGALVGALSVSTAIVYTLWLQVQLELAPLDVAKVLAASGLVAGAMTPLIGRIRRKPLFPALVGLGLLCFGAAFCLCARLTVTASLADLVLPRVLTGLGTALCSPAGWLAIATLEPERVLPANALAMFLRTMAASLLVLISAEGARRLAWIVGEVELANGFGTLAGPPADAATATALAQALARDAATQALHAVCWVALAAMVLLLVNLICQVRAAACADTGDVTCA